VLLPLFLLLFLDVHRGQHIQHRTHSRRRVGVAFWLCLWLRRLRRHLHRIVVAAAAGGMSDGILGEDGHQRLQQCAGATSIRCW